MEVRRLLQLANRLSEAPDPGWSEFVRLVSFSDALQTSRPNNVEAVIALRPRGAASRTPILPLIAVSRFRSPFSVIERVSFVLANTIAATAIIPIINPIGVRQLTPLPEDSPWARRIARDGVLAYRAEQNG